MVVSDLLAFSPQGCERARAREERDGPTRQAERKRERNTRPVCMHVCMHAMQGTHFWQQSAALAVVTAIERTIFSRRVLLLSCFLCRRGQHSPVHATYYAAVRSHRNLHYISAP